MQTSIFAFLKRPIPAKHAAERLALPFRTLDAALVSPGDATPFPVVDRKPDMSKGMTFCLGNNIWGTNYPMWQPYMPHSGNQRFRFEIQALDSGSQYPADLTSALAAQ